MPGPSGPNQYEELTMTIETQQAQFRFIGARHLSLSPLNVRKTATNSGIEQLADLIVAEVYCKTSMSTNPRTDREDKDHARGRCGRSPLARLAIAHQAEAHCPQLCSPLSRGEHERAVQSALRRTPAGSPCTQPMSSRPFARLSTRDSPSRMSPRDLASRRWWSNGD